MNEKSKELFEFIHGLKNEYISCNTEILQDMCERHEFDKVMKVAKVLCGNNYGQFAKLACKIVCLYPCDRCLIAFSKALSKICHGIITLRRYKEIDELPKRLLDILAGSYNYSNEALYYFAQTLEILFAMGYKQVGYIIFSIYQKIESSCIHQYTALTVSKQMSCVYVIGDDNAHTVAKICKKVRKAVHKGSMNHVRAICYYYLGLLERYDYRLLDNEKIACDCWIMHSSGYMERSKDMGFSLAKKYIKHHSHQNFVTSQEYLGASVYEGYENSECEF